ncbi:MAG: N-acetylmuramoyl-L-alanine amidase [Actinomycetota bacterium]
MDSLIREGDHSQQVADVQARLRSLGYSVDDPGGHFGSSTVAAVRAFQQQRSTLVDGIVGPHTWNELVEASWQLGDRTLYLTQPFMRGDDVAELQRRLNALGFDAGREDGIFGPLAYDAVKAFQKEYGIPEDGMLGQRAYSALLGLRVERPGTAAHLREELRHKHGHSLHGRLVMIDPGHGPGDEGLSSRTGTTEAEICWELAGAVAERLGAAGARVRFTRNEPECPAASERAQRANELDTDLFVSLHLNSNEEATAEGASAYHFGTSRAGAELAESIQSALVGLGARDCRVHPRSYPILRETKMPAVLVEPAFITNIDEAKRLEDPDHRAMVAQAIVEGIARFYQPAASNPE